MMQSRSRLLRLLPPHHVRELRSKVSSFQHFALGFVGINLHPYQLAAGNAILNSVFARDGNTFVIIFARQSGKDELLANLILFLLARLGERGASIVCAQPTFRPQTLNAVDRLQSRASQRPFFMAGGFHRSHGYIYRFLRAKVTYLSAAPSANVVGATADRLLIINEAQDIRPEVYDKRFAPMAASGNATQTVVGTPWTSETLLEREKRRALQLQEQDGVQRLFIFDGEQVAQSNPLYGRFLASEIAKLGRLHPLIRTQYFCETVDARSPMFTAAHLALIHCDAGHGSTPVREAASDLLRPSENEGMGVLPIPSFSDSSPLPLKGEGKGVGVTSPPHAFLLDVAGQEESNTSYRDMEGAIEPHLNPARDSITLRIVEIDLSTLPTLRAPTYRAVYLRQWTGENHNTVFGQLKALAESWRPRHIVIDATGVGEGLWARLDAEFPTRVIPVKFTQSVKSELGYGFLAIINSGRFRDCVPSPETDRQYAACESEILIGPQKTMRWGVPDGRRDADGRLIHDDISVTDSLTAILDRLTWSVFSPTLIVPGRDPLDDMSHFPEVTP